MIFMVENNVCKILFDKDQTTLSEYFNLEDPDDELKRFIAKTKARTKREIKIFGGILTDWHEYKPFHLKTCNLCGILCGYGDTRFTKGSVIRACNRGKENG